MVSRRPKLAVANRKGIHLVTSPTVLRIVARQRIHWIGATEFSHLIRTDPELVIFRLIDARLTAEENARPAGVVAVTLEQLSNTIPWIPCGSRIVIYRLGGISEGLAGRVSSVLRGRKALFFSGDTHQVLEPALREPDFAA